MPEVLRNTFYTTQPGKAIWSIYHLLYNFARFPILAILFIPKGLRPDPRWTWSKAIKIRLVRAFLDWSSAVEMITPFNLEPAAEKEQWVTVSPADSKYFQGPTVIDSTIKPTRIGGTWSPSAPSAQTKTGKVVLSFHGGAFVINEGRNADGGFLAKNLLRNTGVTHVFNCQYRLASNPLGRFPAALQDAVTAYTYLLNEKNMRPEDIIVCGDSAGGNLTLALLRYIADYGSQVNLPAPSCAWLWSPWVDPGTGIKHEATFHLLPNYHKDYVPKAFGIWGAKAYMPLPSTGMNLDSEYINFTEHPFKTETPLLFNACENELLFNDILETRDSYAKLGNKTEVSIAPAAPHDIMLVGRTVGFQKEAADVAKEAWKFYISL